ncbi:MAG TPA: zinc-dependent alcohol dehydrogenase family protein [Anaerolineales bacterium]|jgi:propanol-preferring alcohol dehydrogenase
MKAFRLHAPAPVETSPLVIEDIDLPQPASGQVRIKVAMCGICHTDLHTVEGEIHPPNLPVTPGHQVVGTLDALSSFHTVPAGPGQRGDLHIGQRVGLPWLYSACGDCEYCLDGMENLCPNARFTGFHVDGGYAEYVLAEARYVLPLPDELSFEQAAPLLCAGIVGYRSLKRAEIRPGESVGLFGFGASAHLCIQILNHWGCKVSVFTRAIAHQEHARQLGAVWSGSAGQNPERPLDRAVIFAPSGGLVVRALECLKPGGVVAINAIHMSEIPAFPYEKIYGERAVRSVANATYQDGEEFLALALSAGLQSTVNLYPFNAANHALQDLKGSRFNGEAVLKVN